MKKLIAGSLLFAACAFAADTWTGVISDAKCGAAHASNMNAKCVKGCVKSGQEAVFVTDGKVVKIDAASKEKVMPFLGEKVTITGTLNDDTVTIDSVKAAD